MLKKAKKALPALIALLLFLLPARAEGPALHSYRADTGAWDYVLLGSFPTDADETVRPILWRVLLTDHASALLLSDRILFSARVDVQQNTYPGWEQSELYEYLNGEFLKTAFSWAEQNALARQMDRALVSLPDAEDLKNPRYGFSTDDSRCARGTAYAAENGLQVYQGGTGHSPYWTKTLSPNHEKAHRRVIQEGRWGYLGVWHEGQGVRPMVQLKLEDAQIMSGLGTREDPYVLSLPEPSQPEPRDETADLLEAQKRNAAFLSAGTGYEALFPALTEEGFLPQGEAPFSLADRETGLWLYASPDLRIEIVRKTDTQKKTQPLLWYEADIYVRPGSSEYLKTYYHQGDMNIRERTEPEVIARENGLVFSLNTDYYLYRVLRNARRKVMSVGVILRGGEILYDDPARKDVSIVPNRDLMALYPDGRMEVYDYNGTTAKALKKQGASDVLCFGPILLKDGQITPQAERISKKLGNDPRTALGMAEIGHYVAVMVEGRTKASKGCTLLRLAELMREKKCVLAFNLDGGGTSSMTFMGELLNQNTYSAHLRGQAELLGIGKTE